MAAKQAALRSPNAGLDRLLKGLYALLPGG